MRKMHLWTVGIVVAGAAAVPSVANHAWSNYHWSRTDNEITVPVIDNTNSTWNNHVTVAVSDWNQSPYIQAPLSRGNASSDCPFVANEIHVCNDSYGSNGWLGIASITLSGGHIAAGITKLNDTYFNTPTYNNPTWRQLVTCQEIGHDYGLGHQNENFNTDLTNSCMEYTSQPQGNEHPDAHDYEQLALIYAHSDGGGGGGGGKPGKGGGNGGGKGKKLGVIGNTPASWGRVIDRLPDGSPHVYAREEANGDVIVTHVTWAIGEAPKGKGRGGGHAH